MLPWHRLWYGGGSLDRLGGTDLEKFVSPWCYVLLRLYSSVSLGMGQEERMGTVLGRV